MLVLSRKVGEKVIVFLPDGETLVVCVTETDRGHVRLGFDAPKSLRIYREELIPPGQAPEPR